MPEDEIHEVNNLVIDESAKRLKYSQIIQKYPDKFHVCDNCNSISLKIISTCPVCHGYVFIDELSVVISTSEKLGQSKRQLGIDEDFE